jgi:DNA primase
MANPLDSVVASYVTIKRSGRNYVACCPFHSEKTPSFHINVADGYYKCFGCGVSGDVFSFIMGMEKMDFVEALRFLAERAGMQMPKWDKSSHDDKNSQERKRLYALNREANIYFYRTLKKFPHACDYWLNKRQLSVNTIQKVYYLGYAPSDWNVITYLKSMGYTEDEMVKAGIAKRNEKGTLFSFFRDRVTIPIMDIRGNFVGFGGRLLHDDPKQPKYLNTSDTPVFKKSETLFSLNLAKNNISNDKTLLLAEGYMDVIALYQAGFKNAVATLGTSLTPEQVNLIKRYADNVIICYDNDKAGITATNRAIGLFLNSSGNKEINVRVLRMSGAKDPDEYIKTFGNDRFKLLLDNAMDAIDFQISQARDSVNLNTNAGKVELLRHCAEILAQVQNETTREVYVSSVARECNIEPSVFSKAISDIVQQQKDGTFKRNYHNNYNQYGTLLDNHQNVQRYNQPNVISNLQQTREQVQKFNTQYNAEREIIANLAIIRDADLINYVMQSHVITYFRTYANILRAICLHVEKVSSSSLDDITIVHEDLSEQEFSELCGIMESYRECTSYSTAEEDVRQCIQTIERLNDVVTSSDGSNDLNALKLKLQRQHNVDKL